MIILRNKVARSQMTVRIYSMGLTEKKGGKQ